MVDRLSLLRMAWQIRKLGRSDMRELLRIGGMNVYDLLEENFDSAALKALGFDAVLGANFGPPLAGNGADFIVSPRGWSRPRAIRGYRSQRAEWVHCTMRSPRRPPRRGPYSHRVCSRPYSREADRACGVVLESGGVSAKQVISNADQTTFLKLLGTQRTSTPDLCVA